MTDEDPEKREDAPSEEERLRKLLGEEEPPQIRDLPEFPEPPSQAEIDARLSAARGKEGEDWRKAKPAPDETIRESREATGGLANGLAIAYTLIGGPVAGLAIGWLIENATGVKGWQGGLTVVGAILGVVMAIRIINRSQSSG